VLNFFSSANTPPSDPLPSAPILRLRRQALLALIGLLSLLALYHLAIQPAISELVTGVPYINSYGRQRMLSQRLTKALLATQYGLSDQERKRRIEEAHNSLEEWSQQHHDLLTHDVDYLRSPEIDQSIQKLDMHFRNMVAVAGQLLKAVEANAPEAELRSLTTNLLNEEPLFLDNMNRIVGLYEEEVRRRVSELRTSGWIIFALLIAIALFLHVSILSPAIRSLSTLYKSNLSRYRTLVENMNDGLALVDRIGTVQFANRRLLSLLEVSPEELLGRRLDDFLVPSPDARSSLLRAILHQEITESRFHRTTTPAPLDAVVRCQSVEIDVTDSDPVFLVVLTDITEEKSGRERLKELQNQLARVNRLKTVGEMTAGLAHELGQPICAISAFVGSCRNQVKTATVSPDSIDEQLQRIDLAATRAAEILTRFRNYGRMTPQILKPLNFPALISDIEKLCQPLFAQASAKLVAEIETPLPTIEGDQLLIQQVLINLIQNSVHALDGLPGERRTLTLKIDLESESTLQITLMDRGRGISSEEMSRMQEAFFTTRRDGLGLGLAICRTIIEEHEGHLCFTSESGVGTTVRISLPVTSREPSNV